MSKDTERLAAMCQMVNDAAENGRALALIPAEVRELRAALLRAPQETQDAMVLLGEVRTLIRDGWDGGVRLQSNSLAADIYIDGLFRRIDDILGRAALAGQQDAPPGWITEETNDNDRAPTQTDGEPERCAALFDAQKPSSRCQFSKGHAGIHQAYRGGCEWYDGEEYAPTQTDGYELVSIEDEGRAVRVRMPGVGVLRYDRAALNHAAQSGAPEGAERASRETVWKAIGLALKHGPKCECRGCADIYERLSPYRRASL